MAYNALFPLESMISLTQPTSDTSSQPLLGSMDSTGGHRCLNKDIDMVCLSINQSNFSMLTIMIKLGNNDLAPVSQMDWNWDNPELSELDHSTSKPPPDVGSLADQHDKEDSGDRTFQAAPLNMSDNDEAENPEFPSNTPTPPTIPKINDLRISQKFINALKDAKLDNDDIEPLDPEIVEII